MRKLIDKEMNIIERSEELNAKLRADYEACNKHLYKDFTDFFLKHYRDYL